MYGDDERKLNMTVLHGVHHQCKISSCVSYAIGRYMMWTYVYIYIYIVECVYVDSVWPCTISVFKWILLHIWYREFVSHHSVVCRTCAPFLLQTHVKQTLMKTSLRDQTQCVCECARAWQFVEKEFSTRFLRIFEQLFGSGAFSCVLILLFSFFLSFFFIRLIRISYILCKCNAQFYSSYDFFCVVSAVPFITVFLGHTIPVNRLPESAP